MRKVSLTIQGLFLVSIPLCFEIVFVAVLWNLQREADAETAQALKVHEISTTINELSANSYSLWDTFHDSRSGAVWIIQNFRKNTYQKYLYELQKEYEKLQVLTADQPELNASARRGEKTVEQGIEVMSSVRRQLASSKYFNAEGYRPQIETLRDLYQSLVTEVMALAALHEKMYAQSDTLTKIDHRNLLLKYTIAAVCLNGLFSVVLAVFLMKGVIAKLKVMNDNARRVSLFEPLNPPISGRLTPSEIEDLDRAFHWMNESLLDAARARQDVYAMVTHDLRTPLTVIKGSLEMIDSRQRGEFGQLNERGENTVRLMARNCTMMMGLINDLLDLEKINSGTFVLQKEQVCLADVFEEVRSLIGEWCATHKITLIFADTALFVNADHGLLVRVLYNLVSNAAKFSSSDAKITVAAVESGPNAEITVADTGKGIPEHLLDSVFDRFRQVDGGKKKRTGSGLGLTICKSVVDLHGGRIWVTSKAGEGAVFHVALPRA
ncbi:MAG TPA: HAMP domain-containing sensor histidine kinase [Planktothrix sp.]|jgi:signal transduction histidine kinase